LVLGFLCQPNLHLNCLLWDGHLARPRSKLRIKPEIYLNASNWSKRNQILGVGTFPNFTRA
jgi:hypothetical protein